MVFSANARVVPGRNALLFGVLLLALCSCLRAYNRYSSLSFSASNSFGEPLEGVGFYLQCPADAGLSAASSVERSLVCTSGSDGRCQADCRGCRQGSTAILTARYYGAGQQQTIPSWQGANEIGGWGCMGPDCCYKSDPTSNPVNPFYFNTSELTVRVVDDQCIPQPNVQIFFNDAAAFESSASTDANGQARIENIPRGDSFTVRAESPNRPPVRLQQTANNSILSVELRLPPVPPPPQAPNVPPPTANASALSNPAGGGPSSSNRSFSVRVLVVGATKDWVLEMQPIDDGPIQRHVRQGNFTLAEGSIYYLVVSFGGAVRYRQRMAPTGDVKVYLSEDQFFCDGTCAQCGCEAAQTCTQSPVEETWGCCPYGQRWAGTARCVPVPPFKIYFIPIGADPNDENYLQAVAKQASDIESQLHLGYENYVLVDQRMDLNASNCDQTHIREQIQNHFRSWVKSHGTYDTSTDPNNDRNRVIGVDMAANTCNLPLCGFTNIRYYDQNGQPSFRIGGDWVNAAYINARDSSTGILNCGQNPFVALHELGHTFGLCDQYNPTTYDSQNSGWFRQCLNSKPTAANSDLRMDLCTGPGVVCANGVNENGFMSVMGSARETDWNSQPIQRHLISEERTAIERAIEKVSR